ncbi:hypothetical protein J7L33_02825 [Candidatus Bathyarchaeota archaeon]|nr:hypothetical protein [Candidatus Bathyarchaeota archaeon]
MSTFIGTSNVKILLDAGVSLAPNRFGFPPHPLEYKAIIEARKRIKEVAEKADVITISHYHFDHHTPSYRDWCYNWTNEETAREIYQDKLVLAKSYKSKINFNQRRRGWMFTKTGGKNAKKLEFVDGRKFNFGETTVIFSKPVFHGSENTALGWVLMTLVEYENERVLFAPDVQGPMCEETLKMMLAAKPQLLIIGGPPIYLAGFKVKRENVNLGIKNLEILAEKIPNIILEHHLLRDENWREHVKSVFEKAYENGHNIFTAAEYMEKENSFLESVRDKLYNEFPPVKEFEKWSKLPLKERKVSPPPV